MAMSSTATVAIPQVEPALDQLATTIGQLDADACPEILKVLMETELDARMAELLKSLGSDRKLGSCR